VKEPQTERAAAYRKIAAIIRKQIPCVWDSGWGFFSRRCAVLNLEATAELCDTLADSADMGIDD
jgi:hypothetical protein